MTLRVWDCRRLSQHHTVSSCQCDPGSWHFLQNSTMNGTVCIFLCSGVAQVDLMETLFVILLDFITFFIKPVLVFFHLVCTWPKEPNVKSAAAHLTENCLRLPKPFLMCFRSLGTLTCFWHILWLSPGCCCMTATVSESCVSGGGQSSWLSEWCPDRVMRKTPLFQAQKLQQERIKAKTNIGLRIAQTLIFKIQSLTIF